MQDTLLEPADAGASLGCVAPRAVCQTRPLHQLAQAKPSELSARPTPICMHARGALLALAGYGYVSSTPLLNVHMHARGALLALAGYGVHTQLTSAG